MQINYDDYLSDRSRNIPGSFIREILNLTQQDDFISLAGGLPNPQFFPVDEFQAAMQNVLCQNGKRLMQYGVTQGLPELREWVANRYRNLYGANIVPEQIIITNGSQQGLFLSGNVFINAGDPLMIEKPSYLGAIQAFSSFFPKFCPVDLEADGISLADFERVAKHSGARLFYGIPNFQNPSGISYSLEKRDKLAGLLRKYEVVMIEDDPYGEIRFSGEPVPPVYSHLPKQVIWSGSFSKMISPGIRMGWLCVPNPLLKYFTRSKEAMDLHSNNLLQAAILQFLTDNDIDEHLVTIRKAYFQQKETMRAAIETYFPPEIKITNPDGGMFLWAELPEGIDMQTLVEKAIQEKVMFVPGQSFFTEPNTKNYMRLNFSNASPENITEGIRRLSVAIERVVQVVAG